jgi:hypothetical protein
VCDISFGILRYHLQKLFGGRGREGGRERRAEGPTARPTDRAPRKVFGNSMLEAQKRYHTHITPIGRFSFKNPSVDFWDLNPNTSQKQNPVLAFLYLQDPRGWTFKWAPGFGPTGEVAKLRLLVSSTMLPATHCPLISFYHFAVCFWESAGGLSRLPVFSSWLQGEFRSFGCLRWKLASCYTLPIDFVLSLCCFFVNRLGKLRD